MLVAVPSKWLFWTHVQCPVPYSLQLEKSNPKTQMIPQWQNTETGFSFSDSQKFKDKWHNLRVIIRGKEENQKKKYQEVGLRWEGNGHIMTSWIFWSTACSAEVWKCSRDSDCCWSCINWYRFIFIFHIHIYFHPPSDLYRYGSSHNDINYTKCANAFVTIITK